MDPGAIDRVLRKHAKAIDLSRRYSAHSMRATFITTALENGATLDDLQRLPATVSPEPPSSTSGAAIIWRNRRVSSQLTSVAPHGKILMESLFAFSHKTH
jgi:hypothetical protein